MSMQMSTPLAELQRNFRSWLVTASGEAAQRLAGDNTAGLAVYQNNYRAQLIGCLEVSFPQLRKWIGDDAFLSAAVSHIDSHPPHAWTLDAYARDFHATLSLMFPHNPEVRELAWIEHALAEAFVARDSTPLELDTLAQVDWDSARLHLSASFMSVAITTNAEHIWNALWEETTPPEAEMLAQQCAIIVWRRGYTSRLKQIDTLEHEALLQLQAHGSFAALCDMFVERLGDVDGIAKVGELLASWISSELITGVETPGEICPTSSA